MWETDLDRWLSHIFLVALLFSKKKEHVKINKIKTGTAVVKKGQRAASRPTHSASLTPPTSPELQRFKRR